MQDERDFSSILEIAKKLVDDIPTSDLHEPLIEVIRTAFNLLYTAKPKGSVDGPPIAFEISAVTYDALWAALEGLEECLS